MADELRALEGVSSVVTVLDVPLLESPPVTLSDITSSDPLPSLDQPGIDLDLVLQEFTTSPIYADLLVSRDGQVSAVQINLKRDEVYYDLLDEREALRSKRAQEGVVAAGARLLTRWSWRSRAHTAIGLDETEVWWKACGRSLRAIPNMRACLSVVCQ